jgi:hypothetical protein
MVLIFDSFTTAKMLLSKDQGNQAGFSGAYLLNRIKLVRNIRYER